MPAEIQKMTHQEHVLKRPGMYIGSITPDVLPCWTFDTDTKGMVKRDISYVPGLLKIFDEILVNAIDQSTRRADLTVPVKNIRILVEDDGAITVINDGDGLPTGMNEQHGVHCPELIFGHMLTSTNYEDGQGRVVGGLNGIGSKACNVWSTQFWLETVDADAHKLYRQEWSDNMTVCAKPTIKADRRKPYTSVRFLPDYVRFGLDTGLTDDMRSLFLKRAYDTCAVTAPDVNVHVNGEKTGIKSFERYADLYLGAKGDHARVYEHINERWEVVATAWDCADSVSFVNGICTVRGGRHVEHVTNQIVRKVVELAAKRCKDSSVKPQHVRDNLFVMVNATVPDPVFDGQTKELLTTPVAKFGCKVDVSDALVERLVKNTDLLQRATALATLSQGKAVKKTDGAKRNVVRVPKLNDANWAGTKDSAKCTLVLTEGDSAASSALAGLSVVGRDAFGVFPLRGKLLNVRDATVGKVADNEEITNVKKILGLESGKTYAGLDDLRYGRVLILADQDVDGSHIKGLLLNVFSSLWPSLFSQDGFISSMATPIVKARKGKEQVSFYNLTEYEEWRAEADRSSWSIKYYKGLGTSTAVEAREYFRDMRCVDFVTDPASDDAMDLAFNKKRADDRKRWLEAYDRSQVLRVGGGERDVLTHKRFVDYELIHFSNYDLERSIPSAVDGLKTSQRKILYSCFKRKLTSEIRVAQLAGYVSEHAGYHHGEASLNGAIVCLAQDYVGANNLNLLKPNGQFGTRLQGGKDAASPRYIYTELSQITATLFRPEDAPVLEYREDDGATVEPLYYVPIVPVVLINGCSGIGTGFSTCVPSFDPLQVVANTRRAALGQALEPMTPWVRGFTGGISAEDPSEEGGAVTKWWSHGTAARASPLIIEITELPVGTWTSDYKEWLEEQVGKDGWPRDIKSYCTDTDVRFTLKYASSADADAALLDMDKGYKLATSTKNMRLTNMHLFGADASVKRYAGVDEIFTDHATVRMRTYMARKAHQLAELELIVSKVGARARFTAAVVAGTLALLGRAKAELEAALEESAYPTFGDDGFDYLLTMPVSSLTSERVQRLEADAVAKAAELYALRGTEPLDMWMKELDELEAALLVQST
jgi:DNA topoisomerase-2